MASSRRSTARAKSSATTSPARRRTSTSSRTRSTSSPPVSVVIALGSNLGDRAWNLRRAIRALPIRVVRASAFIETDPVDAPPGSPRFLNAVVVGYTMLAPEALLDALLALEQRLGRIRRGVRNEPRIIDLDLILHGATRMRTRRLTLPHPRAASRDFVTGPLSTLLPAYRSLLG